MPTTPSRARRWVKSGKATHFWKGGLYCVRLNVEPAAREMQPIAVGIDPGSKKEGMVLASAAHTYLNLQVDARTGVQEAEADSTRMRRTRRWRTTPYRQPRQNRRQSKKKLPPSTRARWQWKLRLAAFLCRLFSVRAFVVEDIRAGTRKGRRRRWNRSFSPLEVGKLWFYTSLHKLAPVTIKQGWETSALRDALALKKTGRKIAEVWEAHAVDAWVLAFSVVGGSPVPDNKRLVCVTPFLWHRRQLHRFQPGKGGRRAPYGGTLSPSHQARHAGQAPEVGQGHRRRNHAGPAQFAPPGNEPTPDAIGSRGGVPCDQVVAVENAAGASLRPHTRNACFLPVSARTGASAGGGLMSFSIEYISSSQEKCSQDGC
jgi:RRXRR protein